MRLRSNLLENQIPTATLFNRPGLSLEKRLQKTPKAEDGAGTLFKRRKKKQDSNTQIVVESHSPSPRGSLFNRLTKKQEIDAQGREMAIQLEPGAGATRGKHRLAFAGIYLFTLLLYARPNDLIPALGNFPLVKLLAIGVMLIYIGSKSAAAAKMSIWTREMTMLLAIAMLGLLMMPFAASPRASLDALTDNFLKTVIIFILMVNLIDTRRRIYSMWKLVVVCGVWLGIAAIRSYAKGEFTAQGLRIEGLVGGMFGNPNDLATALDLVLPFAILLTISSRGLARLFYLGCAAVLTIGVLVTLSRGGFLGLIMSSGVLLWKLGRGSRLKTALGAALICGILFAVMPGGYGGRIATILNNDQDQTGSAQMRRELMERAAQVAISHPIIGVGMGNFFIYSIHDKAAHNAYLEIAAELGVFGLLAYLIVILSPLRSLYRIEKQTLARLTKSEKELYWLSVSIQASLIAYMVCSFFSSIQYLWYLYYTAAYAVALRQIHYAERAEVVSASSNSPVLGEIVVAGATPGKPIFGANLAKGALWPDYRMRPRTG